MKKLMVILYHALMEDVLFQVTNVDQFNHAQLATQDVMMVHAEYFNLFAH